MTVHYCQKCGKAIKNDALECPHCGAHHPLTGTEESEAHYTLSATERAAAEATHDPVAERMHETGGAPVEFSGQSQPRKAPLHVEILASTAERARWAAYWDKESLANVVERALAAYLTEREADRGEPYVAPPKGHA